ncbi:MAG: crotonobetainyl-CoA:carnitine CoA-transferase CaiB-like acyl-CoA transferase [Candidatus Poriferisodalaceae bacterium]|jgi:crotonobetainyl-CoA:carnitine CoA-transferase CaiB-like acyl-CoA transferase|tara:strand:+ start:10277 stop:11464 length:1188 start_codon:yes stop_codon:yes gene_type:complete
MTKHPALNGIRVLDVSSVLSGPLAAMLLADLGAEVIKVEPPNIPDFTRGTGDARNGMTAYFYNTNRGKRAISVNGRQPEGQRILQQLADQADVLIQNMRPGKASGIGLDPSQCLQRNPALIYASINGYGTVGPMSEEPVYDYVIQAVTGIVDVQRDRASGTADLSHHFPADKITSHALVEAILAALFARERHPDRRGQEVEVSMHEANLAYMWPDAMMQHSIVGDIDGPGIYPGEYYRVYSTIDGAVVVMPLMGPMAGICEAINRPELAKDPRFQALDASNLDEFQDLLAEQISKWTTQETLSAFSEHDVPVGPVIPRNEIHDHPQAKARGSVPEHDVFPVGRIRSARPAWRMKETPELLHQGAPTMGEHTDVVLAELGYLPEEIAALRQVGTVA